MRTVPFATILTWVATKMGLDPAANFRRDQADAITTYVNYHLREGWERQPWPEWTVIERRYFGPIWDVGTEYAVDVVVYDSFDGNYYRALVANAGTPPHSSGIWEPVTCNLDTAIGLDQPGQTPIGTVLKVTAEDPREHPHTSHFDFWLSPAGIQVKLKGSQPKSVYVQFRLRPPVFTATAWSSATAYLAGMRAYDAATGECYLALAQNSNTPVTNLEYWQKIDFPYVLANYVKRMCEAEGLEEEGQDDKADLRRSRGETALEDEWDKAEGQQGQERRFSVHTRRAPRGFGYGAGAGLPVTISNCHPCNP